MAKLIAIVDDEVEILALVSLYLKKANFKVREFSEASSFLEYLKDRVPDLLILDLMLPDTNGIDICKYLKQHETYASMPIIMLTAKGSETDKVLGLELGADDYVTKPFSTRELVARVRAVLRRKEPKAEGAKIEIGKSVLIDLQRFEVTVDGKKIDLSATEFRLLQVLAERKGWVFSRKKILDGLWGADKAVTDRTIDVHIKHIREKLGPAGRFIKNVRGIGYKIED